MSKRELSEQITKIMHDNPEGLYGLSDLEVATDARRMEILRVLTFLELFGKIKQHPGKKWGIKS